MAKSNYSGESKQPDTQSSINLSQIKKDNAIRIKEEHTYQAAIKKQARKNLIEELEDTIAAHKRAREQIAADDKKARKESLDEIKGFEAELLTHRILLEHEATKEAEKNANSLYKQGTIFDRQRLLKEQLERDKSHKKALKQNQEEHQEKINNLINYLKILKNESKDKTKEYKTAEAALEDLKNTSENLEININNATDALNDIEKTIVGAQMSYLDGKAKEELVKAKISDYETHVADQRQKLLENELKKQEEIEKVKSSGKSPEEIKKEIDDIIQHYSDEMSEINSDIAKALEDAATYISIAGEDVRAAAEAQNNEAFLNTINEITKKKTDNAAKKELLQGSTKKSKKDIASQADRRRAANRELRKEERESKKLDEAEKAKQANEDFRPLLKENIKQSVSAAQAMKAGFKMLDDLAKSIDTNIKSFYEYQAQINARLQGSNENFKKISKTIKDNVGFSGIVSQKEVVNNIKQLTDSGVAYNLELRAFLATTKDKIIETFDVFDSNLARMIRIQQADTTAARLGMEASLTKLFNKYFSDTSYLKDGFDAVSESILEASAQMSRDASMEFEYIVQKWLGALYSIGLSQETVTSIAQGINYLSTGNIESLNNNDQVRTLFAMAATEAGQDFGELLLEGLDAEKTNLLLKSMVQYLGEIATDISENKVTQSVYADLFGTSKIDLQVFANLKNDVDTLYKSTLTYNEAVNETSKQLNQIADRMHVSQILDTVIENVQVDSATNIGGNFVTYGLWKALNIIEGLTGGISIPAIGVMGNMVDLDTTITALAKGTMAGLSMLSSLIGGLRNGNLFGTLNLSAWGFEEYTSRGKGIVQINQGMASGTSESSSLSGVGNSNAEDIKNTSLTDATDEAAEDEKITNKDMREEIDVYTQIRDALYKDENTTALKVMQDIRSRMDQAFITSGSGGGGGSGSVGGAGQTSQGTTTQTGNASAATELESIINPINSILSELQGIRGRLDQPFASTGEVTSSGNALQTFQEALFGATLNVKVTNLSDLGIISSNKGGVITEDVNPAAPTPGTLPSDISNQIIDYASQLPLTTIIGQLQGIRGRLDQPFASNIIVAQKSFSDLIEETHTNSALIKDTLLGHDLTEIIKNSTDALSEISDTTTIDQSLDAMSVLLSLLSVDRIFKAQVIGSQSGINNNQNNNSNSNNENITNSNTHSTIYVEAIANHTNVLGQLTTAVTDLNTSIVSSISQEFKNSQLVDNISSLQSQVSAIHTALGITNTENGQLKGQVFVNGMADDVKSSLASSIAAVLANALTKSNNQGESISISDIQNMLSLMNLNVTVTNDYFSDVLRKEAFNT